MSQSRHHQIVIIGAGSGGTSVAASLLRQRAGLDVAIIEPRDVHYYQPAFTLVGGGTYALEDTIRDRKSTRLNSSHVAISYAVFCLKKKKTKANNQRRSQE